MKRIKYIYLKLKFGVLSTLYCIRRDLCSVRTGHKSIESRCDCISGFVLEEEFKCTRCHTVIFSEYYGHVHDDEGIDLYYPSLYDRIIHRRKLKRLKTEHNV